MKALEPDASLIERPLLAYFLATRPPFLVVTLTGCLLGLAIVSGADVRFSVVDAIISVVFAIVAQAGYNLLNDYYDASNGTDAINTQHVHPFTGGSRFIQNDIISRNAIGIFGYSLLLLVIVAGLWLTARSAPGLILIGLCGLAIGWAYSAPPLELVSRGLGEICITICWLLVVAGTDFVQRASFAWEPFLIGLPYAVLVALILYMNQIPDAAADAKVGKHTLVSRLGPQYARWGYLAHVLIAYGWLLALILTAQLPALSLIALLPVLLHLYAFRELCRHRCDSFAAASTIELTSAIKTTILATNLHGLLLALLLVLYHPAAQSQVL